ncbi:DEAD/DEAH box helicase [Clostridium sp.]|uniref:DEAD/DEAH box helicase n=1 Tax=Clostridium sp. TaxID=1506 RepID=UPI003EEBAA38
MTETIAQKNKIQANGVKLSKKHRFLCLQWATGCGKTLGALKIADNILKNNPEAVGYLICKESTHKKNWLDDIKKHNMVKIGKTMKTVLYASLKNQKKKADFVILDECHALTEKRVLGLRNILQRGTRIIFLSATIPDEKKYLMNNLCKTVYYDTITLNQAFKLNLLPEPSLMIHEVSLSDKVVDGKLWDFVARKAKGKKKITKFCKHNKMYYMMKTYPKEVGIICQGTETEHYKAMSDQMSYYYNLSQDRTIAYPIRTGCRNKYLNTASTRKRFIAEVKTRYVKSLVKDFRSTRSRFICFTGSIKQVKEIGNGSAVHSDNEEGVNQGLIDCFNRLECDELFAVKMLREGVNLTKIEKGVITQLDSGIGSFFQMLGRCLRHEFPELHLFVIKDTQDEVYFKKSMKGFNQKYVKWV